MTPEWKNIYFSNSDESLNRLNERLFFFLQESLNINKCNFLLERRVEYLEAQLASNLLDISAVSDRVKHLESLIPQLNLAMKNLNLDEK